MKTFILFILSIVAVLFVMGSGGALMHGNIGFGRFVLQVAIGVIVEWFALKKMEI